MADDVVETRRDWEVIQQNATDRTERLKVPNGYLYRLINKHGNPMAVTFVPGLDVAPSTGKKPSK